MGIGMKNAMMMFAAPLLAACANDVVEQSSVSDAAGGTAVNGEYYYNLYCSGCHETGMLGAPVAGVQQDWAERSQLWDAVLFDHAITGYLEMPAKGGRTDLPDDVVKSAAEYMLRITFPDRLQDCNPPACMPPEQ
jgi:cytochrome c5